MKMTSAELAWDYSELAAHYDNRPDYSSDAISDLFAAIALSKDSTVVDMGAGTGMLTRHLHNYGCAVTAVEPNHAMRALALAKADLRSCRWLESKAEATGLPEQYADLVIFGSSFNVVDRTLALNEAARLLKPGGHFACLWNHRDLQDPIQRQVENIIKSIVPEYDHGVRRQDQSALIALHERFPRVYYLEKRFRRSVSTADYLDAWRSHATLARQVGGHFSKVISEIESMLSDQQNLVVPYHTRIWYAPLLEG